MRLTRFTDYSIRTLVYLGKHAGDRVTIGEISEAYDISKNHLMKVVSNLTRVGIVAARRGPGGGIRLNRPAKHIHLGEVVRNTERHLRDGDTAGHLPDQAEDVRLQGCLQMAIDAYLDELNRFTLADLLEPHKFTAELAELKEKAA